MSYTKRFSGRKFDELRPCSAKVGVVKNADGSAMFKMGNTIAVASVYGPKELHPQFLRDAGKGKLRCYYNMVAFSGSGNRVRPGPSRRSKEIGLVAEKALLPFVDLSKYGGSVVDVFIEMVQTDAGTRCAGINAAALALAHAGIPMTDIPVSIAVGKIEDKLVVDLDYEEDSHEIGVDIPIAMSTRTGEVSLLQMDGIITPAEFKKCVKNARKACEEVKKVLVKALKDYFVVGGKK